MSYKIFTPTQSLWEPASPLRAPSLLILSLMYFGLNACAPDTIKQYRVAKVAEKSAATQTANEALSYTTPKGWQKQPGSAMRAASFSIEGGGDVSVVTLPGMAGDLKSNLNRWRGQVGLAPLADPAEIKKSVNDTTCDSSPAVALELYSPSGKPDKAMRVVLLEKNGATWFFKLAGPAKLVKQQKGNFEAFTHSIKIKAGAAGPPGMNSGGQMPPMDAGNGAPAMQDAGNGQAPEQDAGGQMPPMMGDQHPDVSGQMPAGSSQMNASGMPPVTQPESNTTLTYKVPSSWTTKAPGSIRIASFEVKKADQVADISIVNLVGDGGGLLSNANRWRQQLEMAPTDQDGLKNLVKDIQVDGHKGYYLVLFTGLKGQGMLVALIEQGGQTWFVKMVAPSQLIQSQEKDFQAFVQSIQFHTKGSRT